MTLPGSAVAPLVSLPAVLVEAFADGPCCGNGAAVVQLHQPMGDVALQAIARSLNQSETAFLLQQLLQKQQHQQADEWATAAAAAFESD